MRAGKIQVIVQPGLFPSERTVSFRAGDRHYEMVVDQEDVADGTLVVYVVAERNGDAMIDLPRETFTSGSRIRIPTAELLPA